MGVSARFTVHRLHYPDSTVLNESETFDGALEGLRGWYEKLAGDAHANALSGKAETFTELQLRDSMTPERPLIQVTVF